MSATLRALLRPVIVLSIVTFAAGCASPGGAGVQGRATPAPEKPVVLAVETFLADIAQNVAGDRLTIEALIPTGGDPHSFEPTPADVRKVAASTALIINGAGFEAFLNPLLASIQGPQIIDASQGLTSRQPQPGEHAETEGKADDAHEEGDPHFFLDPTKVIAYVENIRAGLTAIDPDGKAIYAANAEAYAARLNELDAWIKQQVAQVPEARRLLVTNHESFGYFADRYGFRIVGAIVPSVSSAASPSARDLARLSDMVKATGAPAVFLETGSSPQLAEQLASETGIKVVTGLLTHSTTEAGGLAPDYLSMMHHNVDMIVNALR